MIRTTLNLDEGCMKQLKRLARAQNRTLTDLVGEILAEGIQLREHRASVQAPKLPTYNMGVAKLDLANRHAVADTPGS
jgi:hypothetical protein